MMAMTSLAAQAFPSRAWYYQGQWTSETPRGEILKIKVTPQDFTVRETASIPFDPDGPYRVYLLEKSGWNTLDAIGAVARASGVEPSSVGYAGLKDRYALTVQHISVPRDVQLASPFDDVGVTFAGFARDFVSSKVLSGNTFSVVVRDVSPDEKAFMEARLPEVARYGFPNYFDDQRFGSVTTAGEFLAERFVKGHLKGALRIYLAGVFPGQKKADRDRRAAISDAWGHWDRIAPLCASPVERDMVALLRQGASRKNLVAAVSLIPRSDLAMHIAAYQGFLWNRSLQLAAGLAAMEFTASGMVASGPTSSGGPAACNWRDAAPPLPSTFEVPGKVGPYVFYRALPPEQAGSLSGMEIPTVAADVLRAASAVSEAVDAALRERGVEKAGFRLRGIRTAYFKSFYRKAVLTPEDLVVGDFQEDELYHGSDKVRLTFSLPKGSYATMLLKALLGKGGPQISQGSEAPEAS